MAANSRPSICSDPERWKLDTQVTVPTAEHPFPSLMPVSTRDGVLSPAPGLHSSAPLQGPLCKASSGRRNNSASPFFLGCRGVAPQNGYACFSLHRWKRSTPIFIQGRIFGCKLLYEWEKEQNPINPYNLPISSPSQTMWCSLELAPLQGRWAGCHWLPHLSATARAAQGSTQRLTGISLLICREPAGSCDLFK